MVVRGMYPTQIFSVLSHGVSLCMCSCVCNIGNAAHIIGECANDSRCVPLLRSSMPSLVSLMATNINGVSKNAAVAAVTILIYL
jgi:hypothetical protein